MLNKRKITAKILNMAAGGFCMIGITEAIFFEGHIEWLILILILESLSVVIYPGRFSDEIKKTEYKDFYRDVILRKKLKGE